MLSCSDLTSKTTRSTATTRPDGQADGGASGVSGVRARGDLEATRPFTATDWWSTPPARPRRTREMDVLTFVSLEAGTIVAARGRRPTWCTRFGIECVASLYFDHETAVVAWSPFVHFIEGASPDPLVEAPRREHVVELPTSTRWALLIQCGR